MGSYNQRKKKLQPGVAPRDAPLAPMLKLKQRLVDHRPCVLQRRPPHFFVLQLAIEKAATGHRKAATTVTGGDAMVLEPGQRDSEPVVVFCYSGGNFLLER